MPFSKSELDEMLSLAEHGIALLVGPAVGDIGRAAATSMTTVRMVLATANPDKAAEIADLLGNVPGLVLEPRPPSVPEVEEDGETLVDNARLKARALSPATGLPAVADDTGLEVAALGGAPGVYSARFAGHHATYADNVPQAADGARARRGQSIPANGRPCFGPWLSWPTPTGQSSGRKGRSTAPSPRNRPGRPDSATTRCSCPPAAGGRTFAEMTAAEKHEVSHRGRAFRALAEQLQAGTA